MATEATGQERRAPEAPVGFGLTDVMLLGMALIWGVNFSVVKYGTQVVPALAFNGARMVLATAALGLLAWTRLRHVGRRDAVALLLLGVLGNGVYQLFFVLGIERTRAGNAALMLAATPAFIAIIGWLRGIERPSWRTMLGIALSVAGIGIIVFSTAQGGNGDAQGATLFGDLLVLAGCLSWAIYTVLLKPYSHRIDGIGLSAVTMAGGTVVLLLVAAPSMARTAWGALPAGGWGAIVYSGLFALVVAYLFWYRGLRALGPTRTAMYGNLQPVIALAVAWVTLGERPLLAQGVGAVAILAGLLLTRSS